MHEQSLMTDLMRQIDFVAVGQNANRVVGVTVKLGALSHISPDHFREHFEQSSRGTIAENARLEIQVMEDTTDPHAQDILLDSIEVEE